MNIVPKAITETIEALGKLPGVGPRTAERLAFHLLKSDRAKAGSIAAALETLHDNVRSCRRCHTFADGEFCAVCRASGRDEKTVAVVEEPFDVVALEKTGQFTGLYHVLGGVISPMDGIGPDRLEITSLMRRIDAEGIREVILATNPSLEGESTAMYVRQQLETKPDVRVTRLARGLPVGGDLEYADQITLGRALQGRQSF